MKGRSVYSVWLEKFGKEIADEKYQKMLEKLSKASSGENNPMYGEPPPEGTSYGWSGKYKGIHFRSKLELYYLKYLLDNNIKFENGEQGKYKIPYETNLGVFNYFTDYYLLETDKFIEIKPKNLIDSYINQCKFKAARELLEDKHIIITENNLIKISLNEMYELYINRDLIFTINTEQKFLKLYNKKKR